MARQETLDKLVEMVKDIDIAQFTTVGEDGYLVSRPLSTNTANFDGSTIWFFTEVDTPKVEEIQRNSKANVTYSSHGDNTYVSFAGDARLNQNRGLIHSFWNDALKAFFPKGKDDPNLGLIEFIPRTAQYWDGPSSLIGKAVSFLVARVTGNDDVMGQNKLVEMHSGRTRKPPSADGVSGQRKTQAKQDAKSMLAGSGKSAASKALTGRSTKKTAKSSNTASASGSAAKKAAKSASTSVAAASGSARTSKNAGGGNAGKGSSKASSKTAGKTSSKTAGKTSSKTASKSAGKAAGKTASRAVAKTAGKTAAKSAKKSAGNRARR